MKPLDVSYMLSRIGYKPNWDFKWQPSTGCIQATLIAPDTYDHSKDTEVGVPILVPTGLTEEEFPEWMLGRIFSIERHEAREYFTLDGEHIFDPHPELSLPDFERIRAAAVVRGKIEDLIRQLRQLEGEYDPRF